jgi:1,4-alpha-glucan branching enzyme
MFSTPGKKINFMGNEFAQNDEWNYRQSLDWHLLEWDEHKGITRLFQNLNSIYKKERAFFETDFSSNGFEFINHSDCDNSVISYLRKSKHNQNQIQEEILVIINFTPATLYEYRTNINRNGYWEIIFNSDSAIYGGTNAGSTGILIAERHSILLDLPPLGALFLKPKGQHD